MNPPTSHCPTPTNPLGNASSLRMIPPSTYRSGNRFFKHMLSHLGSDNPFRLVGPAPLIVEDQQLCVLLDHRRNELCQKAVLASEERLGMLPLCFPNIPCYSLQCVQLAEQSIYVGDIFLLPT